MDSLTERARKVAELRARADTADHALEREDAALRDAIIASVKDVLPALVSHVQSDSRAVLGIRVRGMWPARGEPLLAVLDSAGQLILFNTTRPPYSLEVAEAISRALDTQLAGLPKAEARQLRRAEDLRVLTRMIQGIWGQR